LGGALGFSAFYLNTQVFRSDQTATAKYLLTGAISLAALVVYIILAGLFQILIRGQPR
jgi:hypothetical protein